jgi:hypothetical protein
MADVCISTVADRHALQSVYYSKTKKTVTRRDEAHSPSPSDTLQKHLQHNNAPDRR